MSNVERTLKVAVAQAAPVLFDAPATLEKTRGILREAAAAGAKLVLLPEAFLPAYPRGSTFGMAVGRRSPEGRRIWEYLRERAVDVPGPVTAALGEAAREASVHLAVGVIERDDAGGTLYCSLLLFAPDGRLIHRHRKIKPTGSERLIWGEGDGSSLQVLETPVGRIGGLICWENYMPLARMALYGQGIEIYLAPTADARDSWRATLRHIACEGRCFVLGCNQYVIEASYPPSWTELDADFDPSETTCRGGSAIYSPFGEAIAGPVYDREEILVAELDLGEIARGKLDFDAVGHYARPDIFQLRVNRRPASPVIYDDGSDDPL